jgi:hypothetical protein
MNDQLLPPKRSFTYGECHRRGTKVGSGAPSDPDYRPAVITDYSPESPMEFKDEVHSDVCAFDQPGFQTQTDSTTRKTIVPGEGNELLGGVIGVISNDHHVTMTRCADKGTPADLMTLRNFAQLISLCP